MKLKVFPYKMGSASGRALAQSVGALRVRPDGAYRPRRTHTIINWGNSGFPNWWPQVQLAGARILNYPDRVAVATNKLHALHALHGHGVPVPEFTTRLDEAQAWIDTDDGVKVVERHKLSGHSGEGIIIREFGDNITPAPLYTKYMKKADEYRVHVFNGEVIDVQQKRKRRDVEEADYQVRNHQNGWVYCREGINPPTLLEATAIQAIEALGLDFGGVDIIYNRLHDQLTVLEVNTACGLEGTTLEKYSDAIKEMTNE